MLPDKENNHSIKEVEQTASQVSEGRTAVPSTAAPQESPAPVSNPVQGNWPPVFKSGQTITKKLNAKDVDRLNTICEKMDGLMVTDRNTGQKRRPNKSEIFAHAIRVAAVTGEHNTIGHALNVSELNSSEKAATPTIKKAVQEANKRRLKLGVKFFD